MKIIYLIIALISFVIGVIGIVVPLLPTTPFLLLTSYCLLRSSDKLNEKFKRTKIYRRYVMAFMEKKGMTLKSKLLIQIPVGAMLLTAFILINSNVMRMVIVILFIGKVVAFSKIKTLKHLKNRDEGKLPFIKP